MAWSTPLTAISNSTLTASQWNLSVRDNLLETAVAKATAAGQIFVSTAANALAARVPTGTAVNVSESTTSTTYTDLTTPGPTVSGLTTGTQALVVVSAKMQQNTASVNDYMAYAVSGATTIAATDQNALLLQFAGTTTTIRASSVFLQTGLTAGSNTFTSKYRVSGGTGTYDNRSMAVIPF